MNFYLAYGLNVVSEILLSELVISDLIPLNKADVSIELLENKKNIDDRDTLSKTGHVIARSVSDEAISLRDTSVDCFVRAKALPRNDSYPEKLTHPDNSSSNFVFFNKKESRFFVKNIGLFVIKNGNRITVTPHINADYKLITQYLLGPVFGLLLYQREYFLLHASTVEINNKAISFLGRSGWGKSTIAAFLCSKGYKLLADDVTAIKFENGNPIVIPAFPRIRLCTDTSSFLENKINTPFYFDGEKLSHKIEDCFLQKNVVLQQAYILENNDSNRIKVLNNQDAMLELIRHSYRVKIAHQANPTSHFLNCADLLKKIKVKTLQKANDFKNLPKLAKMIEEDIYETAACRS